MASLKNKNKNFNKLVPDDDDDDDENRIYFIYCFNMPLLKSKIRK